MRATGSAYAAVEARNGQFKRFGRTEIDCVEHEPPPSGERARRANLKTSTPSSRLTYLLRKSRRAGGSGVAREVRHVGGIDPASAYLSPCDEHPGRGSQAGTAPRPLCVELPRLRPADQGAARVLWSLRASAGGRRRNSVSSELGKGSEFTIQFHAQTQQIEG